MLGHPEPPVVKGTPGGCDMRPPHPTWRGKPKTETWAGRLEKVLAAHKQRCPPTHSPWFWRNLVTGVAEGPGNYATCSRCASGPSLPLLPRWCPGRGPWGQNCLGSNPSSPSGGSFPGFGAGRDTTWLMDCRGSRWNNNLRMTVAWSRVLGRRGGLLLSFVKTATPLPPSGWRFSPLHSYAHLWQQGPRTLSPRSLGCGRAGVGAAVQTGAFGDKAPKRLPGSGRSSGRLGASLQLAAAHGPGWASLL